MNTYKSRVILDVEISAYNTEDAIDAITDSFGPGEYTGVTVTNLYVEEFDAE